MEEIWSIQQMWRWPPPPSKPQPALSERSEPKGGGVDSRAPFHYWNKGSLATIGRAAAVAEFGRIHISGFIAWLAWLFVHILFLIGFRNRLLVFIQWAWSYVTYERGARLITGSTYLPGWSADQPGPAGPAEHAPQEIHTGPAK
jgi:NADH dehydrogenase FAD-containing subunit